ncbi:DUF1493 family protein [Pantoea septica]
MDMIIESARAGRWLYD